MPTGDEYGEALRVISNYIEDIDGEVIDEGEGERDGTEIDGYVAQHGSNQYVVMGSADWEFFRIKRDYSILPKMAARLAASDLDPDDVTGGEMDVEVSDEDIERAKQKAQEIWAGKSEESRGKLKFSLIQLLSNDSIGYGLEDEDNTIVGFTVTKKIYPYENGFDRRRYDRAVMSVINVSIPAQNHLENSYNLTSPVEIGSGSEEQDELSTGRAFQ